MLSIIIPTFNEEKYITKLLESLSEQDYRNFEVIVADGISTDFTREIVEIIAANLNLNLRFIQTGVKHTGMQRNIGAGAAFGDKLAFIDADIILPERGYLDKINKSLMRNMSAAALVRVNPNEERYIDRLVSDFLNGMMMILNKIGIHNGRGAIIGIRKNIFNSIGGFDEKAIVAEDIDILLRVKEKPAIIKPPVYESARRYIKSGYFRVFSSWIIDGAFFHIFRRNLRRGLKPIR